MAEPSERDLFDMRVSSLRSDILTLQSLAQSNPNYAQEWAETFEIMSMIIADMIPISNKKDAA